MIQSLADLSTIFLQLQVLLPITLLPGESRFAIGLQHCATLSFRKRERSLNVTPDTAGTEG